MAGGGVRDLGARPPASPGGDGRAGDRPDLASRGRVPVPVRALGVAALYYVLFVERYGLAQYERIFAACTLAIASSIVVFSVTATPGVRAFAGRSPWTTLRHPLRRDVDGAP